MDDVSVSEWVVFQAGEPMSKKSRKRLWPVVPVPRRRLVRFRKRILCKYPMSWREDSWRKTFTSRTLLLLCYEGGWLASVQCSIAETWSDFWWTMGVSSVQTYHIIDSILDTRFGYDMVSQSVLFIYCLLPIANCQPICLLFFNWHCWLQLQEYGSPTKNGLGHSYTTTIHPVTQKQIRAVFIPKFKTGVWSGSVGNHTAIEDTVTLDNDETALRKNQVSGP